MLDIEKLFSEILFCQFCFGGISVSLAAIQILLNIDNLSQIGFSLTFIFGITFQTFGPCYFGNKLTENYAILLNELYHSNWLQMSIAMRKDIVIFMERLKKPIQISCGKMFFLNLQTFSSVRLHKDDNSFDNYSSF